MKKIFSVVLALAAATTMAFADSKTVNCGTEVTIKAVANAHYHFVQWSDGNTDAQRTVTVDEVKNLTATFAADNTYTLTLNATGAGSVNIIAGEKAAYYEGDEVTIQAVPADDCQEFLYWADDNTNTSATRAVTFTDKNLEFTAVFGVKSIDITITAGEGGTVQFVE